ncbi:unnamed protein product [Calicophoron daubneyi]|uniref:Uncharacterized protein n=1 Tax=Calicophoron daubneyi TaxID=300641 RepID=A0AAV2TG06_CALDB
MASKIDSGASYICVPRNSPVVRLLSTVTTFFQCPKFATPVNTSSEEDQNYLLSLFLCLDSSVTVLKAESPKSLARVGGPSIIAWKFLGTGSLFSGGNHSSDELLALMDQSDHRAVDVLVRDIYSGDYAQLGLQGTVKVGSFGQAARCPDRPCCLAYMTQTLLVTMSSNIGQLAFLHAKQHSLTRIIFIPASPVDKIRRFALRSKKSFNDSFEATDENFFSFDRKIAEIHGFHFASFTVNAKARPNSPDLVDLVEDQAVDCLDADNPERWVVRPHPTVTRSSSFRVGLKRQSEISESPLAQTDQETGALKQSNGTEQETHSKKVADDKQNVGRVNTVCLSRSVVRSQRAKRDPRETFREEVITISNKQQEAKMKRRYALTELIDTEKEYIKALKPLCDMLSRLESKVTLRMGTEREETISLPEEVCQSLQGMRRNLDAITEFSEKVLQNELSCCAINPTNAAECFLKHEDSLEKYTQYLVHMSALVKRVVQIEGFDNETQFPLSGTSETSAELVDALDGNAISSQRTSVSFKYFLELADIPNFRLAAYRGLLRDVARYTARAGGSTRELENAMICVRQASRRASECGEQWNPLAKSGPADQEFNEIFFNNDVNAVLPPSIVRLTDLTTSRRRKIQHEPEDEKRGRLILLPEHLVFAQWSAESDAWSIQWIVETKRIRIGMLSEKGETKPWFELWDVGGTEPLKTIIRVTCQNELSRNAWKADLERLLMSSLNCNADETSVSTEIVTAHEEADLKQRLHYAELTDLSDFAMDSVDEVYVDAQEDMQQVDYQIVDSPHLSKTGDTNLKRVSVFSYKSSRSDDTTSSSYHTAEEPLDEDASSKAKDNSTTLYESYTTLDELSTSLGEDVRSVLDESLLDDNRMDAETPIPSDTAVTKAVTKTITVHGGEQIQFNASFTISGPVAYEVEWMLDGHPIPPELNADMILSDTDTRLLIAHADPKIHSGTFSCRCRLFEGTETAVYFCVNIIPTSPEEKEEKSLVKETADEIAVEAEQDQSKPAIDAMENILLPLPDNQLDLAVGQLLELRIKVDKEAASRLCQRLHKTNKPVRWDSSMVEWQRDSHTLETGKKCRVVEDSDLIILQATTMDALPDKTYTYRCVLKLPVDNEHTVPVMATIPVKFHAPTEEETKTDITPVELLPPSPNESLLKAVSISSLIDIQLIQGQRFRLVTPFDLADASEDLVIWWTYNGEIVSARNLEPEPSTPFHCLLDKTNQTVKLAKPVVEMSDKGTYVCWTRDPKFGNTDRKCVEYVVDVLESDSALLAGEEENDETEEQIMAWLEEQGKEEAAKQGEEEHGWEQMLAKDEAEKAELDLGKLQPRLEDEEVTVEQTEVETSQECRLKHAQPDETTKQDLAKETEVTAQEVEKLGIESQSEAFEEGERGGEESDKKIKDDGAAREAQGEGAEMLKAEAERQGEKEAQRHKEEMGDEPKEEKNRKEEGANRRAEDENKRKELEEANLKAEEERRQKEEEEKRKGEEEAKRKAEGERRRKEEEEATRRAEEEEKQKEEEEAKRKAAEEIKRRKEEEAKRKADEERKRKEEEEARREAEKEKKRKEEEEAKQRAEEERKQKEEEEKKQRKEEKKRKAEEKAKRKAEEKAQKEEEEAKQKAEEEKRRKEEGEAKRKAEEEKKRKEGEEAEQKAEEEKKRKEEERRRKEKEEARRRAEEERKRKEEEEEKQRAEEEKKRKAEETAKRKAEEKAQKEEEEAKRKAEEGKRRKEEEEVRQKAEEEKKRKEEGEAKRRAEEEKKRREEEEAEQKAKEEKKRKEEEERRRKAEEEKKRKEEDEAKQRAEEERKQKEEEKAKQGAGEEEKQKEEEKARQKAEEKKRKEEGKAERKTEEEAKQEAEGEKGRKESEAGRKAEERKKRKKAKEIKRKAEEEGERGEEEEVKQTAEWAAKQKEEAGTKRKTEDEGRKGKKSGRETEDEEKQGDDEGLMQKDEEVKKPKEEGAVKRRSVKEGKDRDEKRRHKHGKEDEVAVTAKEEDSQSRDDTRRKAEKRLEGKESKKDEEGSGLDTNKVEQNGELKSPVLRGTEVDSEMKAKQKSKEERQKEKETKLKSKKEKTVKDGPKERTAEEIDANKEEKTQLKTKRKAQKDMYNESEAPEEELKKKEGEEGRAHEGEESLISKTESGEKRGGRDTGRKQSVRDDSELEDERTVMEPKRGLETMEGDDKKTEKAENDGRKKRVDNRKTHELEGASETEERNTTLQADELESPEVRTEAVVSDEEKVRVDKSKRRKKKRGEEEEELESANIALQNRVESPKDKTKTPLEDMASDKLERTDVLENGLAESTSDYTGEASLEEAPGVAIRSGRHKRKKIFSADQSAYTKGFDQYDFILSMPKTKSGTNVEDINQDAISLVLAKAIESAGRFAVLAKEGETLAINVTGLPGQVHRAVWSLSGQTLQDTEHYQTNLEMQSTDTDAEIGTASLRIKELTADDRGSYELELYGTRKSDTNEEGTEEEVKIASVIIPVEFESPEVEPTEIGKKWPKRAEDENEEHFRIARSHCTDLSVPLRESSTICLAAQFPTMGIEHTTTDFQWLCDGVPIDIEYPMETTISCDPDKDDGTVKLFIPNISLSNAGRYCLKYSDKGLQRLPQLLNDPVARERAQRTLTLATPLTFPPVEITSSSHARGIPEARGYPYPELIFAHQLPPSLSFKEHEKAKLEVKLAKDVQLLNYDWYLDGRRIDPETSPDIAIWRTDNSLVFTILRIRPDLAGNYEVRVHTREGDASTSTKLSVEQLSDRTSRYVVSANDGLIPVFTRRLQDTEVELGDCVRFTARVLAEPPPVIVWKHNGNLVVGDHRVRLLNDEVNPSLTIRNVKPQDRGRYSCIATNSLGRVETDAILTILGVEEISMLDYEDNFGVALKSKPAKLSALPLKAPELQLTGLDPVSVNLQWKPLTEDDIAYTVEVSKDGGRWWEPVIKETKECSVSLPAELAPPLTPLQIRVVSLNQYGLGPASAPIRIPVRACLPQMPSIKPDIQQEDAASVLIQWQPAVPSIIGPQFYGDIHIDPKEMLGRVWYAVEVREGSQASWRRVATDINGLSCVHHLRPGTSCAVRVVAINRFGESTPTPIGLVNIDPNSLSPNLAPDPPWVALSRPNGEANTGGRTNQRPSLTLFWKPAYMPEYCSACVKGLDPVYRIEWRRGRSGNWLVLADDVTSVETGFRLPAEFVTCLLDDLKPRSEFTSPSSLNNQTIELRMFCWNKFGESGPTKPCRLVGSQLFRGQCLKNAVSALEETVHNPQTDGGNELDQIPVISTPDGQPRLHASLASVTAADEFEVNWDNYTAGTQHLNVQSVPERHNRYRIEKYVRDLSQTDDFHNPKYSWKIYNLSDSLIYGENYILNVRPDKEEQIFRVLALDDTGGRPSWMDTYEHIRIPPMAELLPGAPSEVSVKSVPTDSKVTSAENQISWTPSQQHPLLIRQIRSADEFIEPQRIGTLRYRVDVRTTLNDLAPWREVAQTDEFITEAVDGKAEPGTQLIYRVTPYNLFGDGPSTISSPVHMPIMFDSLEGCVEDLRYTILGPEEVQLRWRLGDPAIDTLRRETNVDSRQRTKKLARSDSVDLADRVTFTVELRSGYAGEWSPVIENIWGDLVGKAALCDCPYLDRDAACRVVAYIDGHRTVPSRPIVFNIRSADLVPDFSFVKPVVNVESVEEYAIRWDEPDIQEIYPDHVLGLTTPQTLYQGRKYTVQVQEDGSTAWEDLSPRLDVAYWNWEKPNPLKGYRIRILPENQFGVGTPSRVVQIAPQVVIPDLSFVRPSIEMPVEILAGSTAPELVWQLPRAYTLEKTLTPHTFEVQVRGVKKTARSRSDSRFALDRQDDRGVADEDESIWRVLETNLKKTRLPLERLDPEQEYWLRVVAVTPYGRGNPSHPVRKLVDLAARRHQRTSVSIGTLHEATPLTPTFIKPKGTVIYAPLGGHLELKCVLQSLPFDLEVRFDWYLNDKSINIGSPGFSNEVSRFHSYISKSGDTAVLQIDELTENDFGLYKCKAVNIRGVAVKEFSVAKADAPVFLEVPIPVLTVQLHGRFELPCSVDAIPPATFFWTRDSKRVVQSHHTKIGSILNEASVEQPLDGSVPTIDVSLSVERCIYQDAGLYTLVAENVAGRIQTSCLVHIEENPTHTRVNARWTDIGKHYYVLRRLAKDSTSELRLLIDKKTNQEYVGKLFSLDDPMSRVSGAREFECLSRLCHPNVVQLVDAIVSNNVLVLITERLTGPTLLDSVLSCQNWSEFAAASPENLVFARGLTLTAMNRNTQYLDLCQALSPLVSDTMGYGATDRHKMSVLSSLIKLVGFSAAEPISQNKEACPPPHRYRPEFSAPEVLLAAESGEHDLASSQVGPQADVWSCGVLTYLLLVGWSPFVDTATGEVMREKILNADVSFDLEGFQYVSDVAKEFLTELLHKDPRLRPTAAECLSHPWISQTNHPSRKSLEYRLDRLPKYKELYSKKSAVEFIGSAEPRNPQRRMSGGSLTSADVEGRTPSSQMISKDVKQRITSLSTRPVHNEDSTSDISSRASSIAHLPDSSENADSGSELTDRDTGYFKGDAMITTVDDASEEVNMKLSMFRQNTLTEASQLMSDQADLNSSSEPMHPDGEALPKSRSKIVLDSATMRLVARASMPVFASPLRDSYFDIHLGEARFSCQLASCAYLPPGIHGHHEAISEIYPGQVMQAGMIQPSAAVAAWYLGGCLLSDGPGVMLGAGPGGWLWLCLSDLQPEQAGSVVECVVRNRAGTARTQARLLIAEPPKPPGRPGLSDIRSTEALITWASTELAANGDIIYRVDAKYADKDNRLAWHTLGYTVDCRFLATELLPNTRYRMRVCACNIHGWGNYSVASSEYQTLSASAPETGPIFPDYDRSWILRWRQAPDIYSLSEHPGAVGLSLVQHGVSPLPVSDRALQDLQSNGGLITNLAVLREVCWPEYLVSRGRFSKLIVARTNPMITQQSADGGVELYLPPRLLLKVTEVDPNSGSVEQMARQEAILQTGLNTSSGGNFAAIEDYFSGAVNSYVFTFNRHLLSSGWSLGWLANDAAKPSVGVSVSHWIPGGQLLDVLCSRTEYTEYSIMRWTQQLLLALRWFYSKFYGRPYVNLYPRHVIAARRSSALPDLVLVGLQPETECDASDEAFRAPELTRGEAPSHHSDLWSLGAFVYLLMTGECPKNIKELAAKPPVDTKAELPPQGAADAEKRTPKASKQSSDESPCVDFKKLRTFSKFGKKLVFNCLQPTPKKRGTVDFWLESKWFDMHSDNVQKLAKNAVLSSQLEAFRMKQTDHSVPFADVLPKDLELP